MPRVFRLASIVVAVTLALGGLSPVGHAAQPRPGNYYLALGDSLAYGVLTDGIPADPQCLSPTAAGYVCIFYRYLKTLNPSLTVNNLAIPGADSCVLDYGFGGSSPCKDPLLTHAQPSQLDEAVEYLHAHPGDVSPITLDIGGNDFLPLLRAAVNDPVGSARQLPALLVAYRANLDTALTRLRAAAPRAEIVLCTQYNPLGGVGSPPLPPGVPQLAKAAVESGLNGVMRSEARKHGAIIADVAAAFDAHPGGAVTLTYVLSSVSAGGPDNINIHPTAEGYQVYAAVVIKASRYGPRLTITAKLARTRVRVRHKESVSGRTIPGASVRLSVVLPGKAPRVVTAATAPDGTFNRAFKVGPNRGPGTVTACAISTSAGSVCIAPLSFMIR